MAAKFGTSGLRGLATELVDGTADRYVRGFARYLLGTARIRPMGRVLVARDFRESSPLLAETAMQAIAAEGLQPIDCGAVATPVLALHARAGRDPALMITGSHIPGDRNGIKFYTSEGEIDKADEEAITAAASKASGARVEGSIRPRTASESATAVRTFRARYRDLFGHRPLRGLRIGVYEHSTVIRDLLVDLLDDAGASVVRLERSEHFVAVDTEAVSAKTVAGLREWAGANKLDAIVSADGDGDRPLLADEKGEVVRGDALGMLTALRLGIEVVVTPVTSNSGIEAAHDFEVVRTRVGSPYVIAGMKVAQSAGRSVIGFEANGGTLLGTDIAIGSAKLAALPTRDSVLPLLAVLATAAERGQPVSALVSALRLPVALSDRLQDFPPEVSSALMKRLIGDEAFRSEFLRPLGTVGTLDLTDGLRMQLVTGEIVHLRPSGNAPEMRCYVEAPREEEADALLQTGLALLKEHAARETRRD